MKALVLRQHGGLENLEVVNDHPMPVAKDGHVVIRVGASSFNYHDVFTVKGMPGIKVPLPVVIGLDMAGTITEIGGGVTGWKAGDRVLVNPLNKAKGLMGEMLDGGMAEYCLVSADQLIAGVQGPSTRFASLELAIEGGSLAWSPDGIPLPAERNPRQIFNMLFGVIESALSDCTVSLTLLSQTPRCH